MKNEELLKKILEIRGLCIDRLGAKTAEGNILGELFDQIEEALKPTKK